MRLVLVFGVIGRLVEIFSLTFLPPAVLALADGETRSFLTFGGTAAGAFLLGRLFGLRRPLPLFRRAEAIAVVAGSWLVVAAISSVPYVLAGLAPVDAWFESMSGFTTTGATILRDFSVHDRAFFLWRSMTQWFGGLGVIALFVVILPHLGIAGRQLFFAEASGATADGVNPKIRSTALRLWLLYGGLTLLEALLLAGVAGMAPFDSLCHAMTTMAAGGFSPHPRSVAGYGNPEAEWILVVFMLLGGTSFPLLWNALTGRLRLLLRDGELRFYLLAFALGAGGTALVVAGGIPGAEELRAGAFQSASLISSTGYASVDYNLWGDGARILLVFVMLVGGCAGSAAGGAKAIRLLLLLKFCWREVLLVLHPQAVAPVRYRGRPVPGEALRAVIHVVVVYLALYFLLGASLVLLGTDLVTGLSASLACVGNIGPAFGPAGPMGSYADLPSISKVLLSLGMWLGRLEIVAVLALLNPSVWRLSRWSEAVPGR